MSDYPWHWRIKQGGMVVAGGTSMDRNKAVSEMGHYALVYSQDGPIDAMEMRTGKNKWKAWRQ